MERYITNQTVQYYNTYSEEIKKSVNEHMLEYETLSNFKITMIEPLICMHFMLGTFDISIRWLKASLCISVCEIIGSNIYEQEKECAINNPPHRYY